MGDRKQPVPPPTNQIRPDPPPVPPRKVFDASYLTPERCAWRPMFEPVTTMESARKDAQRIAALEHSVRELIVLTCGFVRLAGPISLATFQGAQAVITRAEQALR